ncbi:sensor histidine kinase [Anaeromicropila populeti]|uniref:GHKL domain-containing protein n=1 Tax=Anaeromicropila populeti TaxID=37658 RepID=A0A1I6J1J7_9FIRM|nr:ATP-binding protein [Anaeromicropila populeti]SFR72799.1 GHKL domain-containing protein [Anaeromicropila populeti]
MELVNFCITKLCFCITILVCVHIFLERAALNIERAKKYLLSGLIIGFLLYMTGCGPDICIGVYVMWFSLLLHEGGLFEKAWIHLFALSFAQGFELLSGIIISNLSVHLLGNGVWAGTSLFRLTIVIAVYLVLEKQGRVCSKRLKSRELSQREELGLVVLALEANLIIVVKQIISQFSEYISNSEIVVAVILYAGVVYLMFFVIMFDDEKTLCYLKKENRILHMQLDHQLEQCKRLERTTRETRAIKHDMHNHIVVLKSLAENNDIDALKTYIKELDQKVKSVEKLVQTGNTVVDAIVNQKIEVARQKNIKFSADICFTQDIKIDLTNLCSIIANSMDNAIEACEKIFDVETRYIKVVGRIERGYFSYIISNPIDPGCVRRNRLWCTDKKDTVNHGYGIGNIEKSVKAHSGKLKIESTDSTFTMYVDIPLNPTSAFVLEKLNYLPKSI